MSLSRRKFINAGLLIACLFICNITGLAQNKKSTVRESRQIFKTYPFSDPNPIPTMSRIYPYFRYDMFTDEPIDKEWKVVELENEYIKIMILPEIGGKIWAAIEKSTGKPFIYYNHVVKFRDIAMRGPWTSGGIEPNYGIIGHTPNCATPVDYLIRENTDGSASCFIGVLDLLTRTQWRMEINLPGDKAYFTTASFWQNSTPLEQPYYTWMNAGIKAAGNLQFIYPGTHYLGHDGESAGWPINEYNGKDISYYENNNFGGPKSYHVFGKYTEFFGGYWHHEDFGMGRYSTHDDKLGKKIWIWGLSQQGMIWEKLLTDSDGQYVEVQSGRLFNQSAERSTYTPFKHRGFAPNATDTWKEYWFPVKGTKGFVVANPFGALNVREENKNLKLYFSPLQNINDKLEIFEAGKLIYSKNISLKPLETFVDTATGFTDAKKLQIKLGGNKLEYSTDPQAGIITRPESGDQGFDWDSVYGLWLQGKEYIRQRMYSLAAAKFGACLKKDPKYLPALDEMAALSYRNLDFLSTFAFARRALWIDSYDPMANFYFGLDCVRTNHLTDAKDSFDLAAQAIEYRSAADVELSKIYFREKNYERAIDYAKKSLLTNSLNLEALQIQAIGYREQNKKLKAAEILDAIQTIDPLNHFVRAEKYLWNRTDQNKNKFVSAIKNEMPQETFLELAIWYANIERYRDAEEILNLSPVKNSEILYWLWFLSMKKGAPMEEGILFKLMVTQKLDLNFPFRAESVPVLQYAIDRTNQWPAKYLLALIYWSHDRYDKAIELMQSCGNEPSYAPFYAARAELLKNSSPELSLLDLRRAASLDTRNWRYGKMLIERDLGARQYSQALETSQKYFESNPKNYQLGMLMARSLLSNKKYSAASELLGRLKILPYEGATDGRRLYRESKLMLAIEMMEAKDFHGALSLIDAARLWPENLGVGKPYPEDTDERLEDWLSAYAHEKAGNTNEAQKALNRIVNFKKLGAPVGTLISAMALKKLNRNVEAERLLQSSSNRNINPLSKDWMEKIFHGERIKLDENEITDEQLRVLNGWAALK